MAPLQAATDPGAIVKGFKLLRVPIAAGSIVTRNLLVKRHIGQSEEERAQNGRTLFVTHLDNYVSEKQLSRCFSRAFGAVEKVELKSVLKKAPKAEMRADHVKAYVNFARVVFSEEQSFEKALAAASGRIAGTAVLDMPESIVDHAERAGSIDPTYRNPVELKREVDNWLANFDKEEEEKKRIARQSAVVDEDGFTKVVSGTTRTTDGFAIRSAARPALKTGAFAEPVNGMVEKDPESVGRKKKKSKEMPDFYRFQQREQKRQEVVDHRKRKVEDEEKVYRLKKRQKVQTAAYVEKPKKKGQ